MCVCVGGGGGGGNMHNPTTDIMEELGLHSPLPQLHVATRDQFQFCAKYI